MNALFGGAYSGRRVLVTGHTGFKGSWLCAWLELLGARVTGLALAPNTQPSHWELLGSAGVASREQDIRDAAAVGRIILDSTPEVIFHLAAQPLVRRSYRDPLGTLSTNVTGLVNLFEAVRASARPLVLINITTDKVYRPPVPDTGYAESDALGGHDPYSASKACAELISESWRESYFQAQGVALATARAGNVIGGGDWSADRLVPDFIRAVCSGQSLRLRRPDAIRPWQHVLEPLSGYLALGQALLASGPMAESWNFGPDPGQDLSVAELAARICRAWPGASVEADPGPHLHEAALLRLDSRKARERLGWRPVWDVDTTVSRTVDWYRDWHAGRGLNTRDDLEAYVVEARRKGLAWAG